MTWDFDYGEPFTEKTQDKLIEILKPDYIQGLTLLGGEPMEPQNQRALLPFVRRVKMTYPSKDIWCYSGYTFEELTGDSCGSCECTDELLGLMDILVDGEFVLGRKNISLAFRGSDNQRIIDLKKTLENGHVTTIDL